MIRSYSCPLAVLIVVALGVAGCGSVQSKRRPDSPVLGHKVKKAEFAPRQADAAASAASEQAPADTAKEATP